jgi:hypothetical protein
MTTRAGEKHVIRRSPLQGLPLPNDLLLLLVTFLTPEDVLALRVVSIEILDAYHVAHDSGMQTCKRLEGITRLRWPWRTVLQRTVIDQGLPLPSTIDLKTASLWELEIAAVRATRFDRRWAVPRVRPGRTLVFDSTPTVEAFTPPILLPAAAHVDDTAPACVRRLAWLPGDLLVTMHASHDLLLWRVPRPEADADRDPAPRQMAAARVFGAFVIDLLVDRAPETARDAPAGVSRLCVASGAADGRLHLSMYEVDPLHASLNFVRHLHVDAVVNKV